jgi:hypothetical protein
MADTWNVSDQDHARSLVLCAGDAANIDYGVLVYVPHIVGKCEPMMSGRR